MHSRSRHYRQIQRRTGVAPASASRVRRPSRRSALADYQIIRRNGAVVALRAGQDRRSR